MPFYGTTLLLTAVRYKKTKSERPLRAEHKRVSLLDSLPDKKNKNRMTKGLRASMTVEAALALPLYIFFLCNVLYIMEAVRFQSGMSAALHETGMRLCEYAYYATEGASLLEERNGQLAQGESAEAQGGEAQEQTEDAAAPWEGGIGRMAVSALLSEGYVRSSCEEFLGDSYLSPGPVQGGAAGISYLGSSIPDEDGCIDLVAVYKIRAFVPVLAPAAYTLGSRFYAHPFTGYEVGSGQEEELEEEEMVYITSKSTQVYHRRRDCSYLQPNKVTVPAAQVDGRRNDSGGKYYPCETCHPAKTGNLVITTDGTRYHRNDQCSALYRDIMEVPLSEVEDTRHACVRCGG